MTDARATDARVTDARVKAGRIRGLDLARAAALIGMFAAHVGDGGGPDVLNTADRGWLWIADGKASALFAVLAGVTMALMARSGGTVRTHAAVRIAVRAALLIAAGYAVTLLNTPIDVVLANLGLLMLMAIPALWLSVRWRAVAAALATVVGAIAIWYVWLALDGIPVLEKMTSYHYPAVAWLGYLLAGVAVAGLDLRRRAIATRLAAVGAGVAVLAFGAGRASGASLPWESAIGPEWASIEAHSYSAFELVGNIGVALLVIGVCLLLPLHAAVYRPALAFGSMSLTMYVAHVLVVWVAGDGIVWSPHNAWLALLTVGLMAAAFLWRRALGAGPLERVVTWGSRSVADAVVGERK